MQKSTIGIIFTLGFVLLESTQFVYFGNLFQKTSPFVFGFLIFGLTAILFIGSTFMFKRDQFKIAISLPGLLFSVNMCAVVTFTAYLLSVQLIEPAVTFTISSGTMPITAYILYRFGIREGESMRNNHEVLGNILIFISIVFLSVITIAGFTGFVRGNKIMTIIGVVLSIMDGVFFTLILVYSQRLSKSGVGPSAVLGLRLPLYVLVTGIIASTSLSESQPLTTSELGIFVAIGFFLTIPPLYLLQKAVAMVSTLTLSALAALGPFVIFTLQIFEGRIEYKLATLVGLSCYFIGALFAAFGAVKASLMK